MVYNSDFYTFLTFKDTAKAPLVLESHPEIDWSDVIPLPQYEGKFPILNIQYNAKCKSTFFKR